MYRFHSIGLQELEDINYKETYPSNTFQWIYNWYSVFENVENNVIGYKKKPYIIAAYLNEELVAIIPLLKLTRIYCKCLRLEFIEFLGQQWSCIGEDIITLKDLDSVYIEELIHWIKKHVKFHFIFLKYIPKSSLLNTKYKLYHYSGAPIIPVSSYSSYEDFYTHAYAKRFRKKLQRTRRKIEKDGFRLKLSYEEINRNNFEDIKRIAKSKEIDGKNYVYEDPNKEKFHLLLYKSFPSHVMFAKFNNMPVAYVTNIDCNGVRIGLDCAFDRDYRIYGVGVQCMDCNIQECFKEHKKKFSFGVGLDEYKFQFTHKVEDYYMSFDFSYRLKALLVLPYFLYRLKREDKHVLKELSKLHCDV
ncbi:GNAT family N-acetyltransferase [Ancylomarina longa]|uniref:GNAT family N-acetyltransferase n=1 Tax=Ancylomarina longa TaxID=2487017 RepID=A0A434ATV9_9BACT|nr:GNAT family N-acetyltransferase [Ancylomarina longa]RUT77877.1 GNAT family N-acetyltransferase [Ancylomarina longa]